MSTYQVGNGSQQIKMAADVETAGLAASRAIVLDLNTADPSITVGQSQDATGDIPRKDIGTADSLKNKLVSVMTKIDLVGSLEARKRAAAETTAKYIFDNGVQGHIVFNDPIKEVSNDFVTVVLYKEVDLTP